MREESRGWRGIEAALILSALLLLLSWSPALLQNLAKLDHCPYLACDFQAVYLPQARQLYQGVVHGDWNYPPLLAILLQPFALLPNRGATLFWTLLQVLLVGLQSWVGAGMLPGSRPRALLLAGALNLLCLPVVHGLKWGQVSLGLGLLAVWALRAGGRSGALLGLAAAIKVYPIFWLVGLRKDRRGVGWALGATLAGLLLPFLLLPIEQIERFHEAILRHQLQKHSVSLVSAAALGGQGLQVSWYRWFQDGSSFGSEHGPLLLNLPAFFSILGLAPLVGLLLGLRCRDVDRRIAHLLCGLSLALQPAWHHYFAFLPLVWVIGLKGPGRLLTLLSVGISALPLFLLPWNERFYYGYSAWGGTTVAVLLAWAALLFPATGETEGEKAG